MLNRLPLLVALTLCGGPLGFGLDLSDSFDDGVIGPPLQVSKYLQEVGGSFADYSELQVDEGGGQLSIHGTGKIDTVLVLGHGAGWIGSAAYLPIESVGGGTIAVESRIRIETATLSRGQGSDSGYMAGVMLEASGSDRLDFILLENITGSRLYCVTAAGGQVGFPSASFSIERGRTYTFRLELDVARRQMRALVDGVERIRQDYSGDLGIARAGVMGAVRTIGDVLDARFDDLHVSYQPRLPVGALRTITTQFDGDRTVADVTLAVQVEGGPIRVRESFDAGWTASAISAGGVAGAGIEWSQISEPTLSYRLTRAGEFSESEAQVEGTVESGGVLYAIDGDGVIEGASKPYVEEVLLTPSFRMGGDLNGCNIRAGQVNGAWIGECVGILDATIVPREGLGFRPAFGTEWSQAAGLDPGLPGAARARFWSNPDDPTRSLGVLARVRGDQGHFDWQGPLAFGANLDKTMCVAFFYVIVSGDQPVSAHIGMGSDDSSGIRVNGEPAVVELGCGGPGCFDGKHPVTLQPGKNLISFYTFENYGGYNACIRFESAGGEPVSLRTTLDPTGYEPPGGAPAGHDCNGNCVADALDISGGVSADRDGNEVPDECEGVWVDCNRNERSDRDDISAGSSLDADADGVPDECEDAFFIEPLSPYCVAIQLDTHRRTLGGEIGLAYDSRLLQALCPTAGADLEGGSTIICNLEPAVSCPLPAQTDRALVVGWVNGGVGEPLPSGKHEVLKLCFVPRPEAGTGRVCAPVVFTKCIGLPGTPVLNGVTDADNASVPLSTFGGEVCGEERPFQRGDVNFDGAFDISDAITLLRCEFLGAVCPTCLDAADFNDDGRIDIADPSYLLNWRFLGGAPPPGPFPECGLDATDDVIHGCVGSRCPGDG